MTQEQADYHSEFKAAVSRILHRYRKLHFMSEQDRRRLMLLLGQMRMVSDSTYILEEDLNTRHDVKIAEVVNLLNNVFENGDEKVVIFSEWERMTRLVAMELDKRNIRYEYLCGNVPSRQRGELVENFTNLPESRVLISTDAGSTGLNLQVASILINLDLPWNPAIWEQRIARIFRIGQERPIQILNLVSKDSMEEGMIEKLQFKTSMFEGVLDGGQDTVFVDKDKFKQFMDDLDDIMRDAPEVPSVEYVDEQEEVSASASSIENVKTEQVSPFEEKTSSAFEAVSEESASNHSNTASSHSGTHPKELINQGISFFSNLAETLKSPETTRQLMDNIVEVNEETGETNIKIPVKDKETVTNAFLLFAKLLSGK